ESWAQKNPQRLDALIRALHRASPWCADAENHADLAHMLAATRYIGAPAELLQAALANQLSLGPGAPPAPVLDFFVPGGSHATFPWVSHALWFYSQMLRWRQIEPQPAHLAAVRSTYRPDIYRRALARVARDVPESDTKVESFFDETMFDPARLTAPE